MTIYDDARKLAKEKVPPRLGQEAFLAQIAFAEDNKDEAAAQRTINYFRSV